LSDTKNNLLKFTIFVGYNLHDIINRMPLFSHPAIRFRAFDTVKYNSFTAFHSSFCILKFWNLILTIIHHICKLLFLTHYVLCQWHGQNTTDERAKGICTESFMCRNNCAKSVLCRKC